MSSIAHKGDGIVTGEVTHPGCGIQRIGIDTRQGTNDLVDDRVPVLEVLQQPVDAFLAHCVLPAQGVGILFGLRGHGDKGVDTRLELGQEHDLTVPAPRGCIVGKALDVLNKLHGHILPVRHAAAISNLAVRKIAAANFLEKRVRVCQLD